MRLKTCAIPSVRIIGRSTGMFESQMTDVNSCTETCTNLTFDTSWRSNVHSSGKAENAGVQLLMNCKRIFDRMARLKKGQKPNSILKSKRKRKSTGRV